MVIWLAPISSFLFSLVLALLIIKSIGEKILHREWIVVSSQILVLVFAASITFLYKFFDYNLLQSKDISQIVLLSVIFFLIPFAISIQGLLIFTQHKQKRNELKSEKRIATLQDDVTKESALRQASEDNLRRYMSAQESLFTPLADKLQAIVGSKPDGKNTQEESLHDVIYTIFESIQFKEWMNDLIRSVHSAVEIALSDGINCKIKVVLFTPRKSFMGVEASYPKSTITNKKSKHQRHFRFKGGDSKNVIVRSANSSELLFFSDTKQCEEQGNFRFYTTSQQDRIRSLCCIPLNIFESEGVRPVVSIHSDEVDMFLFDRHKAFFRTLQELIEHRMHLIAIFEKVRMALALHSSKGTSSITESKLPKSKTPDTV